MPNGLSRRVENRPHLERKTNGLGLAFRLRPFSFARGKPKFSLTADWEQVANISI
jgi:hypothetical protein